MSLKWKFPLSLQHNTIKQTKAKHITVKLYKNADKYLIAYREKKQLANKKAGLI